MSQSSSGSSTSSCGAATCGICIRRPAGSSSPGQFKASLISTLSRHPPTEVFIGIDFQQIVKFKRWLVAGGTYGRLTPVHKGTAKSSPFELDCFWRSRHCRAQTWIFVFFLNFHFLKVFIDWSMYTKYVSYHLTFKM